MSKFFTPFKVGLLAMVGGTALYYSFAEVSKDRTGGYMVYAYVSDAAELATNSAVKVAGINIGEIKRISLATESELQKAGMMSSPDAKDKFKKGAAKLAIRINEDVHLYNNCTLDNLELKGAVAAKTTSSFLGQYYIELSPGADRCPKLGDGDIVPNIYQDPTIGQLSAQVNDILPEMKAVAINMREISESLRDAVGSDRGRAELKEMVDNMAHLVAKVDETVEKETVVLGRIMDNVDDITADLKTVASVGGDDLKASLENFKTISRDVREFTHDEATNSASDAVDSAGSLLKKADSAAGKLDSTLASTDSIGKKVDNGEGVAGMLVNDNETRDVLKDTVEGAGEFVGSLTRMRTLVTFGSEYNGAHPDTGFTGSGFRSYIGVRLQPKPDKFYELEITDDPRSFNTFSIEETTDPSVVDANGNPIKTILETRNEADAFKFTFQMGLNWRFMTLRYGLRDNFGGIGFDFRGRVLCRTSNICHPFELKNDLFDFAATFFKLETDRNPRWRVTALTPIPQWRSFYLVGGIDDILNNPKVGLGQHQRTWFLGLQYRFDDSDLKALMSVVPSFGI
jgi:phospholipid/cholesterol/gamma-HCH transport system substrate-binding protein